MLKYKNLPNAALRICICDEYRVPEYIDAVQITIPEIRLITKNEEEKYMVSPTSAQVSNVISHTQNC